MTKVVIKVSPFDIRYGRRKHALTCPIGLAINRLLRPPYAAFVGFRSIYVMRNFVNERLVRLPPRARKFIAKFDQRERVRPFSFELDIPEECLR